VNLRFSYLPEKPDPTKLPIELLTTSSDLAKSVDSVLGLCKRKGFISSYSGRMIEINDSVYEQEIILGSRVDVLEVQNLSLIDSLLKGSLSRKRTLYIPIEKADSLLQGLNQQLADNGYPFNSIQLRNFRSKSPDTLSAVLKLTAGKQRTIDRVVIKGYKKFPLQTLRGVYNKKSVLGNKTIERISTALDKISFATEARPPEVLFKRDSTILYLYLDKKPNNSAEGLLGFNNTVDNMLEINGFLDLILVNNLNQAETFTLNYRNENEDQTTLDVSLAVPYLFKSNCGIAGNLNIKRRDSTYQNTSYDLGVTYKPNWLINLGLSYRRQESTSLDNALIPVEDFTSDGVILSASYFGRRVGDPLMPIALNGRFEVGFEDRSTFSSDIGRQILNLRLEKLWELDRNNLIYTRLNSAYISNEELQFSELFQLGGIGSIRGFNQNGIDAAAYALIATEYRYRFNDNLYAYSILDGALFRPFMEEETQNLLGIGAGIGILTRAGVLNISVANGRFENANFDLSSTIAHVMLRVFF
jgi:hypothetical protein